MRIIHRMTITAVFIVLPIFLSSCASPEAKVPPVGADEYAVYGALIDTLVSSPYFDVPIQVALVRDSTLMTDPDTGYVRSGVVYHQPSLPGKYTPQFSTYFSKLWPDFDSTQFLPVFRMKNAAAHLLVTDSLHVRISAKRMDFKRIEDSPYGAMYKKGQVLMFWFSRVAFNPTHQEAIVYCEHLRSGVSGQGMWYWLKLQDNRWVIYTGLRTWVA